jgi:DnaJ family protein C protein 11
MAEIPLQEPERRAQAELMFAKLKKSYEVLSDPHRRAIYDCLGKAGLQVLLVTVS